MQVLAHDLGGLAREGQLPGEQLVEHHAEAVEVAAAVEALAVEDLGRHVFRRARAEPVGARGGEPEVGEPQAVAVVDEDVARLEVAVDQPAGVHELQRAQYGRCPVDRLRVEAGCAEDLAQGA